MTLDDDDKYYDNPFDTHDCIYCGYDCCCTLDPNDCIGCCECADE